MVSAWIQYRPSKMNDGFRPARIRFERASDGRREGTAGLAGGGIGRPYPAEFWIVPVRGPGDGAAKVPQGRAWVMAGGQEDCPVSAKSALSHLNRPVTPRVSLFFVTEFFSWPLGIGSWPLQVPRGRVGARPG
jgi:hypothetical protein